MELTLLYPLERMLIMNSMFKEEKKPRAEKFCEWTPVESLFEKSHREQLQFMWRPADIIYRILSDSELDRELH